MGDGTTTNRLTPVDVSGLASGVITIAAGKDHTCALINNGSVKCWGLNNYGELGDGTTTDRLIPVDVSGLTSNVVAVSVGSSHTCVVTNSGGVKCWGNNWGGQLGDGTTTVHLTPVDVNGLTSGVTSVAVGANHTCALTNNGGVKCWGYNSQTGQLGDGTTEKRLTPVDVSGLTSGVTAIAVGAGDGSHADHSCALINSGSVKCWGYNDFGQLGDGTTAKYLIPVEVINLPNSAIAVSAGSEYRCALTNIGRVKCWGRNFFGQLGDGTTKDHLVPTEVLGLTPLVSLLSNKFTFSDTPAGSTSSLSIKVSNTGSAPLTINSTEITGDNYTLANHCALAPNTLAVNTSCEIRITFAPVDIASYEGLLTIRTDAPNSPHLIELKGYGVPPVSVSSPSGTFKQPISTVSLPQTIKVTNLGSIPVTINAVEISGDFIQIHSCPLGPNTLAARQNCYVHVSFTPKATKNLSGTLTIVTDKPGSPQVLGLTGLGLSGPASEWKGSISGLGSVSFNVSQVGGKWSNFVLNQCRSYTCDVFGGCTCFSNTTATVDGPGNIINDRFDFTSNRFSFAGWFRTPITATGVYTLDSIAGNWNASFKSPALLPGIIEPNQGGIATATDGSFSISFPGDAVTTTTSITVIPLDLANNVPAGFKFAGRAFQVTAVDANGSAMTQFKKPFTLEMLYTEADWQNAGIPKEQTLTVYTRNGDTWLPLLPCDGCYQDTIANKFTIVLNQLTEFVLMDAGGIGSVVFLPLVAR